MRIRVKHYETEVEVHEEELTYPTNVKESNKAGENCFLHALKGIAKEVREIVEADKTLRR
jgi:hypothetical protein